jgi:hypothetical protein
MSIVQQVHLPFSTRIPITADTTIVITISPFVNDENGGAWGFCLLCFVLFWEALEFELRASFLLGRCSIP